MKIFRLKSGARNKRLRTKESLFSEKLKNKKWQELSIRGLTSSHSGSCVGRGRIGHRHLLLLQTAENLSEEDRLNIERVKLAWLGAAAIGILALLAGKRHWMMEKKAGMGSSKAASLL